MEQVKLAELNMKSRSQAVAFLKKLWNSERTNCPICGEELELLHKKAKKSTCDWQCKNCEKTYKTINLLNEVNDLIPD